MLITKDQFIHFVNRYARCRKEQELFQGALKPYFESPNCTYLDDAITGLEEMLVIMAECEDEDEIFSWWYGEVDIYNHSIAVQDTSTGNMTEYDVLTPEGLYNYLYDMYHHDD